MQQRLRATSFGGVSGTGGQAGGWYSPLPALQHPAHKADPYLRMDDVLCRLEVCMRGVVRERRLRGATSRGGVSVCVCVS